MFFSVKTKQHKLATEILVKMTDLSLPPRLKGSVKGTLDVRIDVLKANEDHQSPVFVRLLWWGQTEEESTVIPISGGKSTVFKVVTKSDRFREYLRDAGRLFIEAITGRGNSLGFAVVERLERIVDFGGITADDVEVFDEHGSIIALLRCIFMYEESSVVEDVVEQTQRPKVVLSSRHKVPLENAPKPKVTFTELPCMAKNDDEHDYDDVISLAIDQDEVALQQLILKSKAKVTSSEADLKKIVPRDDSSGSARMNNSKPGQQRLPSWNLSTERLKFMSRVSALQVKVRQVSFNPGVAPLVASYHLPKPARQKPSFFVKYALPHENCKEVTFCAKRNVTSNKRAAESVLHFESAVCTHPLRFTTSLLDTWWMSNITMHLYARHLGQRLPLQVGECRLGLKHLLMNSKYSSGAEMKLPLYSSGVFKRHLEKHNFKEEIIGDVNLTFTFLSSSEEEAKAPHQPQRRVVIASSKKSEEKAIVKQQPTSEATKEIVPVSANAASNEFVLALLRVDEGRNFAKAECKSLYLTCRLFSETGESISSPVCWNCKSNPRFELQHVVPINVGSQTFLEETCKCNNLVIEVWEFSEPSSTMVGVSTISLHQLYTAFHVRLAYFFQAFLVKKKDFLSLVCTRENQIYLVV